MIEPALAALAEAAGVSTHWRDYKGRDHVVTPETLRTVLTAIDLPAGTDSDIADSTDILRRQAVALPAMLTGVQGEPIAIPGRFRITREDGGTQDGEGSCVVQEAGYHRIERHGHTGTLAVAPSACVGLPTPRSFGLAVQLYSLRRPYDGGLGDFAALEAFVRSAARHGADAVAISPVHAQFSADPDRFSPYSPSSRTMLSVVHAPADFPENVDGDSELVDWPTAARMRLARFRSMFDAREHFAAFTAFRTAMGEPLEAHARFEAIHEDQFGRDPARWHWRTWPADLRDPASPGVAAFARAHADSIAFHAYLQFLADRGLSAAQAAARAAGMRIGLISDLAVGADGGGSHCWSRQFETLIGLTIGAPPDLLSPHGQAWGLTAFSPRGLQLSGFAAFIEMLRAALRHAGGVRIDHAMGLQRLWVMPDGGSPGEGAYLNFPVTDMLRLLALESHRHNAVVLGEDLGTLPHGFQERLIGAGVLGMRVLWFERDDNSFVPPARWSRAATAMTSTHDLPTVAGWWSGRDLDCRRDLDLLGDDTAVYYEYEARTRDRDRLWQAFRDSGAATGPAPAPDHAQAAVDAACAHIGRAACDFVLLPAEDALGRAEQPNLPGTLDEHPNWRRRLPGDAATMLDHPDVAARLAALAAGRSTAE